MRRTTTNGICTYCHTKISKNSRSVLSHLSHCEGKLPAVKSGGADYVLMLIQGKYSPEYWLVIKAKLDIPMKRIDKFIRDVWVECCGHLSQFSDKHSKIPMTRSLDQVYSEGRKIEYLYDFGSSTEITLSMIQSMQDADEKEIAILFRNEEPEFQCSSCNKKAITICPFCVDEGDGFLCQSCKDEHKCVQEEGEDILSPCVNSPRAGVCGYTGSIDRQIKRYFPKNVL
ncbi:MAG: hypothetical protein HYR67_08000 [Bacteroidetes bacterium]|nr:hypothetical protein [Bacteroidota bacterium]